MSRFHETRSIAITAALALVMTEVVWSVTPHTGHQTERVLGFACALILHILGLRAFRHAVGLPMERFMVWAIGGMLIRLVLLLIILATVQRVVPASTTPFLIGLLTTYLIGSWREIAWLAARPETRPPAR